MRIGNSGGWQTDPRAHPEVDDEEYLERVLSDLVVRHVIEGNNDVYVVGHAGGATMALMAAAHHPRVYAGVAAFMPPKPEAVALPVIAEGARLARAFFVLDEKGTLDVMNVELVRRWARALGIDRPTRQRFWRRTGDVLGTRVDQLEAALPASGSAAVRLLVVDGAFDPFAPTSARRRPPASGAEPRRQLDGGRDAWAFLSGADSIELPEVDSREVEPLEVDADEPARLSPHGTFIQHEDVGIPPENEDFEDPALVFDDDVVTAPTRARGRADPTR